VRPNKKYTTSVLLVATQPSTPTTTSFLSHGERKKSDSSHLLGAQHLPPIVWTTEERGDGDLESDEKGNPDVGKINLASNVNCHIHQRRKCPIVPQESVSLISLLSLTSRRPTPLLSLLGRTDRSAGIRERTTRRLPGGGRTSLVVTKRQ
jgi:hypothetical protein